MSSQEGKDMFEGSYVADKRLIGLRRYWAKKKRGRGKSRWVHHKGGKAKTFPVGPQEGSKKFSSASKIKEDNSRETATDDDDEDDDNDNDVSEEAEETEVDSQDEEERESNASAEKMETLSQGGEQKKLLQLMSEQFNSADIHDESVIVASRRGNRTPRLTRKRKSDVLEGDKTSEVLASLPPPPSQISHTPTSGNIITNALKKIRKEGIESHVPTNVPPTMTRKMRSEIEKKNGKGLIDEKDSSEDTASVSEASEVESKSEETSSDRNIPKNRKKGRGREKTLSESNQDNDSGTESPGVIAKSKKLQSTADEDQHTESPKSSSPSVGRGRSRGRGSSESNISTPSPAGRGKGRGQISSKEESGEKRGRGRPKLNLDRSDGSGSLTTSPVTAGRGRAKKIATVDDANSSHNSSLTSSPGAASLGRGKTKTVAGQVANQNSPSPSVAGVGRGRGKKPTSDDISSQRSSPVNVLPKKAKGKSSESETSVVDTSPAQQRRSTTPHERDPSPTSETKRKRLSLSRDFGTEASQANKRGKQLTVPEALKKQEVGSAVKSYPSRVKKEEQDIVSNVNTSVKSETVIKPETDVKAEETEPEDSLPDVEKEEVDMDVEINADANVKSDLFTKTGKKKKKHFKGLKYSFGNKKKKATPGVGRGRKPSGTTRLDTSQETDSVISEDIDIESLDSSSQDVPSEQLSQDPDALDELTSDAVDNDNEDGELENSMKTQAGEDVLDEDSLDEVSQEECGDEYADETVDDIAAEDVKATEEHSELANEDDGTQETKVEEKTALEADDVKKFDETENIKSNIEKEESVEGISGGNEVACIPSAEKALKESFNKEQEDFQLETDTKKDYPPEVEADTYKDFPLEDEDESHTLVNAGIEEAAEENIVLEPSSEADLELRLDETLEGKKLEVDETELGKDLEDGENIEEEEEEIDPGTEMMEPNTSNFGSQSVEGMESAVSAEALTHTEDAEKPTMESEVTEKSFFNVTGEEHQNIDEGLKKSEEFVETGIEHSDNNEEMEKPEENFVDGSMLEQKDGNEEMKKPEGSIDGENTESFHNVMNIPDPLKEAEEKSDKIEDQPSVSVSTDAPQGVIDASAADPSQETLENSEKIYEDECEEHPEKETTIENVPEESEKISGELNDESVKEPLPLSEHNLRGSVRRRHSVSKRRLEDLGVEGQNSDSSDSVGETRVSSVEGVRKSKRLSRNSSPHPLAFAPPRSPDSAGNGSSKPIASKSSYVAEPTLTNVLCKCQGNENPIADGITGDVYCKAVDSFDGRMIGCCNVVTDHRYVRVSDKIPFMLICDIHRHRLRLHNCCPWCGLFCTQGVFNECRWDKNGVRHYYHKLCALVLAKSTLCPHCGSDQPPTEVQLELKMNRKPVIYLKQQQERKESSARMTWSKMEEEPAANPDKIPEDEPTFDLNGVVISAQRLPLGLHRQKVQEAIRSINSGKSFNIKPSGKGIYWACKQNDLEKLLYVLVNGVSPNMKVKEYGNQTGLHVAASYNSLAAVHVLILAGATLDMVDMQLMSPLMVAITKGHNEVVQYLVQAGASLMAKNQEGMTSLHLAAKCGNFVACQYIVDSGRLTRHSINTQDEGGWTPLVWASENRFINVVKYLVDHGGNPQLCDVEQNTALHWAAFSGSTQICSMLLDRGCSLRSMNAHGDTPLHIAARQNHTDAVVLFLSRGARLDVLNSKQQTPLECAVPESDVYLQLSLNSNLLNAMQQNNYRTEKILSSDIAAGKEEVPIPCVNGMDDDELPRDYLYIAENCEASNVSIDRTITSLKWCECEDGCNADTCSCGQLNFQCWFDPDGRLLSTFNYTDPPMIFECNRACRCNKLSCNNRVVQHGISAHMQLFKTDGKGWGVRALKTIQKGSYVCEYVGEIITDLEADQREDDSYLFDLDNKDSETFCIDARGYGNIARFINHLCEPNLTPVKVFIDHQDLTFPRIAFFANRDIEADEELGFDYGEKFWIIKYKHFTCTCGSEKCKYSSKTIYSTLENYNKRQLQSSKS